jgi:hypothetical protein
VLLTVHANDSDAVAGARKSACFKNKASRSRIQPRGTARAMMLPRIPSWRLGEAIVPIFIGRGAPTIPSRAIGDRTDNPPRICSGAPADEPIGTLEPRVPRETAVKPFSHRQDIGRKRIAVTISKTVR